MEGDGFGQEGSRVSQEGRRKSAEGTRLGRRPKGAREGMWPDQCHSWRSGVTHRSPGGRNRFAMAEAIAKQKQNISVSQKI